MMFLKLRKLHRYIGGNGGLVFTALEINKCKYEMRKVSPGNSVLEAAAELAITKGWDPDKALILLVKIRNLYVSGMPHPFTGARIFVLLEDMTIEKLANMTNRLANMKAFL